MRPWTRLATLPLAATFAITLAACASPMSLVEPVELPLPPPSELAIVDPLNAGRLPLSLPEPHIGVSEPRPGLPAWRWRVAAETDWPSRPSLPVTLAFAGDVHGEPRIAAVLREGANPLAEVVDLLQVADLSVVNLETAVGSSGMPADKEFTFQAPPSLLGALAAAGVDVVNLANNHALDYGRGALEETIALAGTAGLLTVGAGPDLGAATRPVIIDVRGTRVAIVGLSRVLPEASWAAGPRRAGLASAYDVSQAVEAVRQARSQADLVAVTIHWGQERAPCPDDAQLRLATALAEAGADVIAGHHPHVLHGIQERQGALVAWSLGNFVFSTGPGEGRLTGIWTVTLGHGDPQWNLAPAVIDDRGRPVPASPAEAQRIRGMVADRSPGGATCRTL